MKLLVRVTGLLMVLVLLLGTTAACKEKKGSSLNEAEEAYNTLNNDVEKLFYIVKTKHPTAGKLANPLGVSFERTEENAEAEFEFSLDEFTVKEEDKLTALGASPFVLSGTLLTGKAGHNLNVSGAYMGLTIDAELRADDNGVMIGCPAAFNKPYYVPDAAVTEVLFELFSKYSGVQLGEFNVNTIQVASEWSKANLTEEKLQHMFDLLKDVVPINDVTSEEVTVSQLNGNYIAEEVKAECITLRLNSKEYDRFITNFSNTFLIDSTFKTLVISFVDTLIDNGCIKTAVDIDGNKAFNDLSKRIKDYVKEFDAEKRDVNVSVKRYFAKGFDVKLDITVTEKGNNVFDASCWNYYNDTARQFGATLSAEGEEILNIVGGANATDADMDIILQTYKSDVVVDNGVADTQRVKGDEIKASFSTKGSNVEAKVIQAGKEIASYSVKLEGKVITVNTKAEFDFSEKKMNVTFKSVKIENDDGNYSSDVDFMVECDKLLKISGKLSAKIGLDSKAVIKNTSEEGSFVLNGKHDLNYVDKNFTPLFSLLLGAKGEETPDENVSEDVGDETLDITEDVASDDSSEEASVITVDLSVSE